MRIRWLLASFLFCGWSVATFAQAVPLALSQETASQIPAFEQPLPGQAQELQKIVPLKKRSSILNPQAVELVQEKAKADAIAAMPQLSVQEKDAARLISERSARQIQIAIQQSPTPKISNGRPAVVGQIPYQVALVFAGYQNPAQGFFCGGSLIAATWILTAAHCVQDTTRPGDIEIYVGATKLSAGGSLIPAKSLHPHPSFDRKSMENDIELIELSKAADGLAPVALVPSVAQESAILAVHNMGVISGWGDMQGGSHTGSDALLFANIPLVAPAICSTAAPGEIAPSMICAGDGASDSCEGDSGGPLTIAGTDNQRYQEGIVSWGTKGVHCGEPGVYGVYTRVPSFVDWIHATMGLSGS